MGQLSGEASTEHLGAVWLSQLHRRGKNMSLGAGEQAFMCNLGALKSLKLCVKIGSSQN